MTEQTQIIATPPPLTVDLDAMPADDSLARYYEAYPSAQAAFNEAKDRLDALKDGIKFELTQRAPQGTADITLTGKAGPSLRLDWRVSSRFDSKAFVRASPENAALYEQFKKPSGSWTLSVAKGDS